MLLSLWSELSIRHGGSAVPGSTPLSAAAALASSDSVLLLPAVASAAECDAVVQACSQALELGQRLVRLPSIAMAAAAEKVPLYLLLLPTATYTACRLLPTTLLPTRHCTPPISCNPG